MGMQEWQVCQISVGVLGDISRALEDQLQPFCNRLMQILLENLQSDAVNRNVKPQILSAFGDIALAIGDKYEVYLSAVLGMLQSAQVSSRAVQAATVVRRPAPRVWQPASGPLAIPFRCEPRCALPTQSCLGGSARSSGC